MQPKVVANPTVLHLPSSRCLSPHGNEFAHSILRWPVLTGLEIWSLAALGCQPSAFRSIVHAVGSDGSITTFPSPLPRMGLAAVSLHLELLFVVACSRTAAARNILVITQETKSIISYFYVRVNT